MRITRALCKPRAAAAASEKSIPDRARTFVYTADSLIRCIDRRASAMYKSLRHARADKLYNCFLVPRI